MQQIRTPMFNEKINHSENDYEAENNERDSTKRSISTVLSNDVIEKKFGSTPKRYKSLLICVVCNGDAHGYNFDAITCESCKAFFRRNATHLADKLKCHNSGHCDVGHDVKRRCKKCRVEKCVETGMRKEWILTDKEREEKRVKIEENRHLKQTQNDNEQPRKKDSKTTNNDPPLDLFVVLDQPVLNDFGWFLIYSIQDHYTQAVKLNEITGIPSYPSVQPVESTSELFRVPLHISSMRLITYIKQINEFQQITREDQVHLIKSNLLTTCFFHSIYMYDPRRHCYHEENTTDPLFSAQDWNRTLNKQFHLEMQQLRRDLIAIFQLDDIVMKLFQLILLFSNQMSLNQSRRCLLTDVNSLDIFNAQNVFVDLVYRYCLHQYGLREASILFSRYVHKIMKMQQLVDGVKSTIDTYIDVTQLPPLMQSLLN